MAHTIKSVKTLDNYILLVVFNNGVEKKYDVKILFDIFPQFKDFKKITGLFNHVKIDTGGYGISWNDKLDLDSEEIWEEGIETGNIYMLNTIDNLAASLVSAREKAGLTQKQLSERTGIYQSDISKIERGLGNPSLSTLKRLADGMEMVLNIEFM